MFSGSPHSFSGNETSHQRFRMPPVLYNSEGKLRKVGYEFEFSGLSTMEVARLITEEYGGKVDASNRYYVRVRETTMGDFTVKIDTSFLYEEKYRDLMNRMGFDEEKMMDSK